LLSVQCYADIKVFVYYCFRPSVIFTIFKDISNSDVLHFPHIFDQNSF